MFVQSFIHALEKNALVSAAAVLFIKTPPQKTTEHIPNSNVPQKKPSNPQKRWH